MKDEFKVRKMALGPLYGMKLTFNKEAKRGQTMAILHAVLVLPGMIWLLQASLTLILTPKNV